MARFDFGFFLLEEFRGDTLLETMGNCGISCPFWSVSCSGLSSVGGSAHQALASILKATRLFTKTMHELLFINTEQHSINSLHVNRLLAMPYTTPQQIKN